MEVIDLMGNNLYPFRIGTIIFSSLLTYSINYITDLIGICVGLGLVLSSLSIQRTDDRNESVRFTFSVNSTRKHY